MRCLWFALSVLVVASVAGAVAPPPSKDKAAAEAPDPPDDFVLPNWRFAVKPGDQKAALVLVRMAGGQCTGTIVGPARADGREEVLCASHCAKLGERVNCRMADGRVFGGKIVAWDNRPDLSWIVSDQKALNPPSRATLARGTPLKGTRVWHAGFGIDRPGNVEEGQVLGGPDSNGQVQYYISVSPGDSGGGTFRSDNGELVGAVCCTTRLSGPGYVWMGGPLAAWRLRPGAKPADVMDAIAAAKGPTPVRPKLALHPTLHICDCE